MGIIEIEHLRKEYGETVAVRDITFSVEDGEIFGLLGPNGAGKTTTVETMVGLRVPDAGTIRVLGLDPQTGKAELRRRVGVQLQESALQAKLRVKEAVALYASFYEDSEDPAHLLDALDLSSKRNDYYSALSGGQKQRLAVVLALIGRPKIAVLDELTTGLDPSARHSAWQLVEEIRDRGVTIVLVTHYMDEAERLCDRVALIDHGDVIALDTPERLADQGTHGKQVRFRPSAPFDDAVLAGLPEVSNVEHDGSRVVVSGSGNLVNAVILTLDRQGVTADDVRLESGTLEDAFLSLTGREIHEDQPATATATAGQRDGSVSVRERRGANLATSLRSRPRRGSLPKGSWRTLVGTEWRLTRRTPVGLIWGVGLPVLLLVIFGSLPSFSETPAALGGLTVFEAYLPILIAVSMSLLALVSLPIPLATYRESRILKQMETTPIPPTWVLGAQVVINLGLLGVAMFLIVVIGTLAFGSHFPRDIPGFLLSLVLGAAAMFALGILIAAIARTARAAGAIGGALFYPMAFLAGLWFPVQLMATPLRLVSHLTPLGAAVDAMQTSIAGNFPSWRDLLVMIAWTAGLTFAAVNQFRWE
jgi:ABC-2 type transport system ATP-binding protein